MSPRNVKPPAVPGTWIWLEREIRKGIDAEGIYRAARANTLGRLEALGFTLLEERLAEWCDARHLVLRIADGHLEVRKPPKPGKPARVSMLIQQVIQDELLF